MFTVFETPLFSKYAEDYLTEDERGEFAAYIATHPEAGQVVPKSGGVRKVRWGAKGSGKSGGVRVIYYNQLEDGKIWLLVIYGKGAIENLPAHILKKLKEDLDHG